MPASLNQMLEIKALAGGVEIIYLMSAPTIISVRLDCPTTQELINQLQVAMEAGALMQSQRMK